MSEQSLRYELANGYIHNWLVAGPHATSVPDLERFQGEDVKQQIARHYYSLEPGVALPAVENGKLTVDGSELNWEYYRCQDDHLVDVTAFYHTCHYLRTWAYIQLFSPQAREAALILTTNGPADLWLNGQHVHRHEHWHRQIPASLRFQATLQQGRNDLLVRFEQVAMRDTPYAMALQLAAPAAEGAWVQVPTALASLELRRRLEERFATAYLEREVYVWDDEVIVRWPEGTPDDTPMMVRFQTPEARIYAEALKVGPSRPAAMQHPFAIPEGRYHIALMPRPQVYYQGNIRIVRNLPLWAVKNRFSEAPYGTLEERRAEALLDAAQREEGIFSEIAKMALGYWADVTVKEIMTAIEGINQRKDCSDFFLVGLLGMIYRYGQDPYFPEELKRPLEECILGFKYWMDEPGGDAMCYWSENHQILFHTCEVLAGQLYPDRTFSNTGQTGAWHRAKGERLALAWLRKRAAGGFREWDSNCYFEEDLLALSHLADLAEDSEVFELASVTMDKMLFTMAVNSFKGTFGSTHGRTYASLIKSGRLEATSGISRLMWGMGAYNQHTFGTVSLACAASYDLPTIIQVIAAHQPEELWQRERHAGSLEAACDCATGQWEVNKVTYKTPDYMLCSAQDYRPGQQGGQEHIWQATLGPDAVVFVSHPPCLSEEGSHRPNYWHGHATLPRVAQWKDTLIAIHNLPADDWMGFTHAFFPAYAFDEHELRDGWVFARKGDGYLALTASAGIERVTWGDSAYRELRSTGRENIWLCLMGRATQDGPFVEFQERILALRPQFEGLNVRLNTLRGESLAFGWEGPLLLNGQEQPLGGFKHYEGPYCIAELGDPYMDIQFGEAIMRLHFGEPPEAEQAQEEK